MVLSSVNTVLSTSRVGSRQLRTFKEVSKSRNDAGELPGKANAPSSDSDLWPQGGKIIVLQEEMALILLSLVSLLI